MLVFIIHIKFYYFRHDPKKKTGANHCYQQKTWYRYKKIMPLTDHQKQRLETFESWMVLVVVVYLTSLIMSVMYTVVNRSLANRSRRARWLKAVLFFLVILLIVDIGSSIWCATNGNDDYHKNVRTTLYTQKVYGISFTITTIFWVIMTLVQICGIVVVILTHNHHKILGSIYLVACHFPIIPAIMGLVSTSKIRQKE